MTKNAQKIKIYTKWKGPQTYTSNGTHLNICNKYGQSTKKSAKISGIISENKKKESWRDEIKTTSKKCANVSHKDENVW